MVTYTEPSGYSAAKPARTRSLLIAGGLTAVPTAARSYEALGPSKVPGWPWISATMRLPSALTA